MKIIAGFPGTGKTTVEKKYPNLFKDIDQKYFMDFGDSPRDSHVLDKFIENVLEVNQSRHVFLLPTIAIIDRLTGMDKDVTVVIPRRSNKQEYIRRYKERGNDDEFIGMMEKYWDDWHTQLEKRNLPIIYLEDDHPYMERVLDIVESDANPGEFILRGFLNVTHKYPTREAAFKAWQTTAIKQWNAYVFSLTCGEDSLEGQKKFYCISPSSDPRGAYPQMGQQNPDVDMLTGNILPPHHKVYSSIEGAYRAYYDVLKQRMVDDPVETDGYVFHIFEVEPAFCRILTPDVLTNQYLGHASHMTGEYNLFGNPIYKHIGRKKFIHDKDTIHDRQSIEYKPYASGRYEERFLCYDPISTEDF